MREEDERGEPLRVGLHVRHVDALGGERLAHEAAVVLVADAREHRHLEPEAARAYAGIGRAAAEVLGEAGLVLQARADLLAVEVDRGAPHADQIERFISAKLLADRDHQRLREAHRRDQHAERLRGLLLDLEADLAHGARAARARCR